MPRAKNISKVDQEIDKMFERMQDPQVQRAMDQAFRATPEELGKAAVEGARKRKKTLKEE
jgi:hypothetical protein